MQIKGYAAFASQKGLREFSYTPKSIAPHEVEIKIIHCGICHSDIHLIDNDWQVSKYPFIPGHEIIGTVSAVGKDVCHLKAGDRVGVGWQAGSCHSCEWCGKGDENLCASSQATCVGRHGGYADRIIVDGQFAFVIPPAIESEHAAPLMCAGVTVFSPLSRLGVKPGTKVGVVGIGGLGHLALQFARALGCEVTAFSTSAEKKKEAEGFGAARFVVTTQKEEFKKAYNSVDVLLSVVTADLPWAKYLNILRPNGKLVVLGASPSDMTISPGVLLSSQKSVVGSNTGGIPMIRQMLDFAGRHQIRPKIELWPLSDVNQAIARVRQNQVRYRMVLACGA